MTAGYYDFLITYIRRISQVDGISQLREADATIWLNNYVIKEPFEGARFIIQKTEQMKDYLAGNLYYISRETAAIEKSIIFLERLRNNLKDEDLRSKCDGILRQWKEAKIV
jgi:hypothetical protein